MLEIGTETKSTTFTFRLTPHHKQYIQAIASKRQTTMGQYIHELVEQDYERINKMYDPMATEDMDNISNVSADIKPYDPPVRHDSGKSVIPTRAETEEERIDRVMREINRKHQPHSY